MSDAKLQLCAAAIAASLAAPVHAAEPPARSSGIYEAVGPDTAAISDVKTASASGWSGLMAAQQIFLEIPEAPSAALLIIGLAAVGVAARRRAR